MNENDAPVLRFTDEIAFAGLLLDLKSLYKQARKTGAAYSRTLEGPDGKPLLRLELHFFKGRKSPFEGSK